MQFRHDINKSPNLSCSRMREMRREPEVPEERVPVVECLDGPARIKRTCTNSFCEQWHPPECMFYKTKSGCRLGKSAHSHTVRLRNSRRKGLKRMMTKV